MDPERTAAWVAGMATGIAALIALACWPGCRTPRQLLPGIPGLDGRPPATATEREKPVAIGAIFVRGTGVPADSTASWPSFRGPGRDNLHLDGPALADAWPEAGPPQRWQVILGEGHAAPAIHRGRVFIMDYDETERADMLRCLSLADGREVWRRGHHLQVKRNHGMSRTIPAVTDDAVVAIGPRGHVLACDPASGDLRWGIDLVAEHGAKIPGWYTGQCPLIIDGDTVVVAPAGPQALLLGIALDTGEIRWRTPNPDGWEMSHASVMPMDLDGRRTLVYAAVGGVCGIAADGPDAGRILWRTAAWAPNVAVPSPVVLPDGRLFLCAGYGAGGAILRIVPGQEDGTFAALLEHQVKPSGGLSSEQQTPLFLDGHLFAILPKDAGPRRNEFVCVDPGDISAIRWGSGRTERFGLGPYLAADGKFLILDDRGTLTMAAATAEGWRRLAKAEVIPRGRDAWGPLAIADGLLLLRDSTRLLCLDLRASR